MLRIPVWFNNRCPLKSVTFLVRNIYFGITNRKYYAAHTEGPADATEEMTKTKTQATQRKIRGNMGKGCVTPVQDTFDVLVLATMSAGKSSFINALVSRELLPSANEATTACLTSIEHRRTAKTFRGACYSNAGARIGTQKYTSVDQCAHGTQTRKQSISTCPGSSAPAALHRPPSSCSTTLPAQTTARTAAMEK